MADNASSLQYDPHDVRYYNDKRDTKNEKICQTDRHEEHFTPVNELDSSFIKKYCKDMKIFELVQTLIKLSVRIIVTHSSAERPQEPDPNCMYQYHNVNEPRAGSGTVLYIKDINQPDSQIEILTAKHVVYDSDEAKKTTGWLFFDGPESNVVEVQGIGESESDGSKDWCKFVCEIDKEDIKEIDKIKESLELYEREIENLKRKKMTRKRKCILISHPHGCYTYVSMGEPKGDKNGFITYDTPTCGGSSGSYLVPVGYLTKGVYVHSGSNIINGERLFGYSSGEIMGTRSQQ